MPKKKTLVNATDVKKSPIQKDHYFLMKKNIEVITGINQYPRKFQLQLSPIKIINKL